MTERWRVVIIGGRGWWACGPALELRSRGRDAYRSTELSPFPTVALSGRDRLTFGGRDRLHFAAF